MKKSMIYRIFFYLLGLIVLSAGITLNTKANLGVSCVTTLPYAISEIFSIKFSYATLGVYMVILLLEAILRGKAFKIYDLLQIPFSLAFSAFLDIFDALFHFQTPNLFWRIVVLAGAILLTAAGAVMTVGMKFVPNPPDGLAAAIGDAFHKGMGFGKNVLDFTCVGLTCLIGLCFSGGIVGVGIGTLVAMIGVGRCVALFNKLFGNKLKQIAGLN